MTVLEYVDIYHQRWHLPIAARVPHKDIPPHSYAH